MAELSTHRLFEQQYFYPFETYRLVTTFVAFNAATNTPLPIVGLTFSDSVDNFQPEVEESETQTHVNNTLVNSRTSHLTIQRAISTQVFVIFILLTNWTLTALVVYITYLALRSNLKLGDGIDGMVLLPVMLILALPKLRQFFVDAPPIGELSIFIFLLLNTTTTDTGRMQGILIGMLYFSPSRLNHLISIILDALGLVLQMLLVVICCFIILLINANKKYNAPVAPLNLRPSYGDYLPLDELDTSSVKYND